ncbi:PREDICTED: uncharacterized protein LOC109587170 [Amphimedon queenslandica]|nr:PREDICTED: uncharacterized protein LOC109587170 [Amphimedon queenslandica]|eukprot:XP_019858965.1 PREDICTED: uncharacterized protein LOC109587170 [Amphimedon queenslandica]
MGNENPFMQDVLPVLQFFVQPLYENKRLGREWLLMFLFGRDLNAIKMYMKDEFNRSKSDKELSFQFESSEGFIEIDTDTENCSEGWSIRPHQENPTQVSQSIIDIYGRMNPPCFPHCRFTITATPGSTTVNPELKHPVTFRGIISNNTVFNIVLSIDQQSPEEILRKYKKDLSEKMPQHIDIIVDEVFSSDYISIDDETRDACRANTDTLLKVLADIINQPGVLTALIDILKKVQALKPIAENMEHEYNFT